MSDMNADTDSVISLSFAGDVACEIEAEGTVISPDLPPPCTPMEEWIPCRVDYKPCRSNYKLCFNDSESESDPTSRQNSLNTDLRASRQTSLNTDPVKRQTSLNTDPVNRQTSLNTDPVNRQTSLNTNIANRQTSLNTDPVKRQDCLNTDPVKRQTSLNTDPVRQTSLKTGKTSKDTDIPLMLTLPSNYHDTYVSNNKETTRMQNTNTSDKDSAKKQICSVSVNELTMSPLSETTKMYQTCSDGRRNSDHSKTDDSVCVPILPSTPKAMRAATISQPTSFPNTTNCMTLDGSRPDPYRYPSSSHPDDFKLSESYSNTSFNHDHSSVIKSNCLKPPSIPPSDVGKPLVKSKCTIILINVAKSDHSLEKGDSNNNSSRVTKRPASVKETSNNRRLSDSYSNFENEHLLDGQFVTKTFQDNSFTDLNASFEEFRRLKVRSIPNYREKCCVDRKLVDVSQFDEGNTELSSSLSKRSGKEPHKTHHYSDEYCVKVELVDETCAGDGFNELDARFQEFRRLNLSRHAPSHFEKLCGSSAKETNKSQEEDDVADLNDSFEEFCQRKDYGRPRYSLPNILSGTIQRTRGLVSRKHSSVKMPRQRTLLEKQKRVNKSPRLRRQKGNKGNLRGNHSDPLTCSLGGGEFGASSQPSTESLPSLFAFSLADDIPVTTDGDQCGDFEANSWMDSNNSCVSFCAKQVDSKSLDQCESKSLDGEGMDDIDGRFFFGTRKSSTLPPTKSKQSRHVFGKHGTEPSLIGACAMHLPSNTHSQSMDNIRGCAHCTMGRYSCSESALSSMTEIQQPKSHSTLRRALLNKFARITGLSREPKAPAFQVDQETHDRILQDAQNTKATNVILNVAAIEASDLKHAAGSPNSYCTLGLVTAHSPGSSPTSGRKSSKSKTSTEPHVRQQKQTIPAKNTTSPKWNDSFELEVADMQQEELQVCLYHQPLQASDRQGQSKANNKGIFKKKLEKDADFIGKCIVPLKGIPSTGHENWFTIYTDKTGKLEKTGSVKLKLDFALKQENKQSHWAESDQCTVEEFQYVTKAMYRYSVLATAQSAKTIEMEGEKPTFQGLPKQLRTILHQFAVQNQFSKLTQILVEAVVVMELCADRFCPCEIPEKLLRESVVELELEYTTQRPLNEERGTHTPLLSNVERALFDHAAGLYVKQLAAGIKHPEQLPRLFPAAQLLGPRFDFLNKKITLAVTVLNMQAWQNDEKARKDVAHTLSEQIQLDVSYWVTEQLKFLNTQIAAPPNDLDHVIPNVKVMTSIVTDSLALLRPVPGLTTLFNRLSVDYFKVVSLEMERRLSDKTVELMLEMDKYQKRYHRYPSNIRESSKVWLHFYFALRKLFGAVRNNVGDRDMYKIRDYQSWFENAAVFWLQTFREECIKRMEKALEIDKDVVQVTSQAKFSNSSVDVLSCFAIIAQEWNDIDFADADIGLLGCTKVTYTICDGATQYAGRIQSILETNGYYDFIDNAQFDVTDQLCITLNNIMHVHQYLAKLPELLRFDTVCHNMSVKHEDDNVGQKNREMLQRLVESADREMLLRAHLMIQTITDKMAVDISGFCKNFTRKHPDRKSSLDPLLRYLQENLQVLDEKLEKQLFPMILRQIWHTILAAVQETMLKGKTPDYYQHQLEHVAALRNYIFQDMDEVDATDEGAKATADLYATLTDYLHMQPLTAEQLLLIYYKELIQSNTITPPVAYYGHVTLSAGYRKVDESLEVHVKVCSAQNLPGVLKDNTCNPFINVTLFPHTEAGLQDQKSTKVVAGTLSPTYNENFVFSKHTLALLNDPGACVVLSAWNHESLFPHDFLGELVLPLAEMDNMARVTSVDELTVRMRSLTRPLLPEEGAFKLLQERAGHEKQAKWLLKQRCVMAGWEYPVQLCEPFFKVVNQVKGKRPDLKNNEYDLSVSLDSNGQELGGTQTERKMNSPQTGYVPYTPTP